MFFKVKSFISEHSFKDCIDKTKMKIAVPCLAVLSTASSLVVSASAEETLTGWTSTVQSSMFDGMFSDIKSLIPVLLPVMVSFLAFRKGWNFLRGQIKSA